MVLNGGRSGNRFSLPAQTTILTMVFKLCLDAEKRWKKLYGFSRLAKVIS